MSDNMEEGLGSKYIPVPRFYAGADVFLTGGTGFMGKVLIEKLIRSCPDIGQVFILLRPRRGRSPEERIDELVQVPVRCLKLWGSDRL